MRRRIISVCTGAVVAAAVLLGAGYAAAADSIVTDPNFAEAFDSPIVGCIPGPPVHEHGWQRYSSSPGYAPVTVTTPTHDGPVSLHVSGPPIGSCANYGAYQDLAPGVIPENVSLTFSFFVLPKSGAQQQTIVVPWVERDDAGPGFYVEEDLTAGTVTARAWGEVVTVPYSFNPTKWHHMVLSVSGVTHTATLKVDGKSVLTTPPGSAFPFSESATVWFGQPMYSDESPSDFYYDGVTVRVRKH